MITGVLVGLDLGTTTSKAIARDVRDRQIAVVEASTPWTTVPNGTETSADSLFALAINLLTDVVHLAEERIGPVRVLGVGVAGLAESGVLLDASGKPSAPVIAWFDKRGGPELGRAAARAPALPQQFSRRTGLPWDCQASLAKLLWLQSSGVTLTPGHRWLSVPEWVVHRLGGDLVREPSLASRTGLIDQATGSVWNEGLDAAGIPGTLLPPPALAGTATGALRAGQLPPPLRGAALTVAGHDHPVAAVGVGAVGPDELFNSSGTADVSPGPCPASCRTTSESVWSGRDCPSALTCSPGRRCCSAASAGVCSCAASSAPSGRPARPSANGSTWPPSRSASSRRASKVSGAGPTGDDVVLRLRDDVAPAHVWAAATRYTAAETGALIATIESIVGPHRRAVASGGWTRMESVRAAKRRAISDLEFSDLREPGVVGAALLAGRAAGVRNPDLAARSRRPPSHQAVPVSSGGTP